MEAVRLLSYSALRLVSEGLVTSVVVYCGISPKSKFSELGQKPWNSMALELIL